MIKCGTMTKIKHTIAIASGKGGVGKSTTAVNLAYALQQQGFAVGLLDADIYGPSIPSMLGSETRPETRDGKLLPVQTQGIKAMSIAYLIETTDTPMAWRGPMATTALKQLYNDTLWGELDVLLIDLPPGTGDIQLTLAQKIPLTGGVIVTTPQDIALLDASKACQFFAKVKVPVLGVIENMSLHRCVECGHESAIFGEGGGQRMADEYDTAFLGALPLDAAIRICMDEGQPDKLQTHHASYQAMADAMMVQAKARRNPFPKVVVEHT